MNRNRMILGCLVVSLVLAAYLLKEWLSTSELKVPTRPHEVPLSATWIGEEWVNCNEIGNSPMEFTCKFYDDVSGKELQEGRFVWRGRGDPPVRAGVLLEQPGWDGTALSFAGGQLVSAIEQPE